MRLREVALPLLAAVVALAFWDSERITATDHGATPVHVTYWEKWGGFEADGLFTAAVQQVMAGKKTAAQAMKAVAKSMDAAFSG